MSYLTLFSCNRKLAGLIPGSSSLWPVLADILTVGRTPVGGHKYCVNLFVYSNRLHLQGQLLYMYMYPEISINDSYVSDSITNTTDQTHNTSQDAALPLDLTLKHGILGCPLLS